MRRKMAMLLWVLCVTTVLTTGTQAAVWYVDGSHGASGNGTSWHEAFRTIQEGLSSATSWDEVWVKSGTYALSSTITMNNKDTKLYGGFAGGETQRDQRDWKNNETIIDGQDTVLCFHIIWASPTIDGFTITRGRSNPAPLDLGGAILFDGCMERFPFVVNCRFTGNYAGYGGGAICNYNSSPRIINSVFWQNTAYVAGGAMYNDGTSSPFITNCTFSKNNAFLGGAIASNHNGLPTITNSILWGDTVTSSAPEITGPTAAVSYSDIDQSGYSGVNGNIRLDPLFVSPDVNNFQLRPGSPCIDTGTDNAYFLPILDIDGDQRRVDGNSDGTPRVDIGADEYVPGVPIGIWYVNGAVSTSGTGTSWAQAFKTIQEAASASVAGDQIWVRQGTYLLAGPINVNKAISIYGGFAGTETQRNQRDWQNNVTTVNGQNTVRHCFYITTNATIDGFTVTGGNANGGGLDDQGGGFFIMESSTVINNCTITGNQATYGGGGIYNYFRSSLILNNCILSQNTASGGGGAIHNRTGLQHDD